MVAAYCFFLSLVERGEYRVVERAFLQRYVLISGGTPCLISELSLVLYLYKGTYIHAVPEDGDSTSWLDQIKRQSSDCLVT